MVCQKTSRRLSEDCQKTTRRPLAVFWWSSNTMIQGNFYKRLHFYMDSCAISPMASLFMEYTEKKTCFSNSAGILGQHDIVVLADVQPPPPQKSWILPDSQLFQSFPTGVARNGQFHPIRNFSNLFPLKYLRMTWNSQFYPSCNFSHQSGSE